MAAHVSSGRLDKTTKSVGRIVAGDSSCVGASAPASETTVVGSLEVGEPEERAKVVGLVVGVCTGATVGGRVGGRVAAPVGSDVSTAGSAGGDVLIPMVGTVVTGIVSVLGAGVSVRVASGESVVVAETGKGVTGGVVNTKLGDVPVLGAAAGDNG